MVGPFTRIRIPFVSHKLNIPEADVEQLLVALILDGRIHGRIDQVLAESELEQRAGLALRDMRTLRDRSKPGHALSAAPQGGMSGCFG